MPVELVIPAVDGHLKLINLGAVDSRQDVAVELLPFELSVGRVAPSVVEQVHGKAFVITLRPEQVALHPRHDMGGHGEQAPRFGPQTRALPPVLGLVAPTA